MTLDAKVPFGAEIGKRFLIRPVRTMATEAIDDQVPVSQVDDLRSDRVAGMPMPVVARTAQIDDRRIVEEKDVVRRVRGVAL